MSAQPDQTLDPVEAIKHICTIIEATAKQAHGTPADAPFREICNILDKALSLRRRKSPTRQ